MDYFDMLFKDGDTIDLSALSDIEYITVQAILGRISMNQIITYMVTNNLDELVLTNGIIIKQDRAGYYIAVFDHKGSIESIGLELFLVINKKQYGNMVTKSGDKNECD